MPLNIPDEFLTAAGLNETEARIEIACRLFDAGKLSLRNATRLARLSRTQFESELLDRRIPLHRFSDDDLRTDLDTLDHLGA